MPCPTFSWVLLLVSQSCDISPCFITNNNWCLNLYVHTQERFVVLVIWMETPRDDEQDEDAQMIRVWSCAFLTSIWWCLWGCFDNSLGDWIPYLCESKDLKDSAGLSWCFSSHASSHLMWQSSCQVPSQQCRACLITTNTNQTQLGGNSQNDALKIHEYRWL